MVLHHQILSSHIPSPPLNTDLDCHCFILFPLLWFSLILTSFTSVITLFLLVIPTTILLRSRILSPKMVFPFMMENFSRLKENIYLMRDNFPVIKECSSLIKENYSFIKENLSLVKLNLYLKMENFSLTKENISLIRENFFLVKEFQILLIFGIIKRSIIPIKGIIRNIHCNYRERLNRPAI